MTLDTPQYFERLVRAHEHHSHQDPWWIAENETLQRGRALMRTQLMGESGVRVGPIGFIPFSYIEMGSIDSLDLFGLDELILFAFYWCNRRRYRVVADLGANVGLHSVILGRMGFDVVAYEPDPAHMGHLKKHVALNQLQDKVRAHTSAVATVSGPVTFIRVLGNTTGSHVAGAKSGPYGLLETFQVDAVALTEAVAEVDLVKMDVEGLEGELLTSLDQDAFERLDVVCEVGSSENAVRIWNHFGDLDVNLFPQKCNWTQAMNVSDLPTSHREGSLFISGKKSMPWNTSPHVSALTEAP